MTVHFVGAGPGAADLITVRGAELVARCPVVIYTGSLVPRAVVARARHDARVLDSSSMTLDEIVAEMEAAHRAGDDVARLHTGDPCLFGSIAEQIRRLDALGIPYDVVPGVSSFTAAAAALRRELTLPGVAQAVIVARPSGRTPVPKGQRLEELARHGATLAVFLGGGLVEEVVASLVPAYGGDCPTAIVQRASWPEERVVQGTLATIAAQARAAGVDATAMILVGRALAAEGFPDSRLYATEFSHGFRDAPSLGREELVAEALLARHVDPSRVHRVPEDCCAAPHRVAWALERLDPAPPPRDARAGKRGLLLVYTGDGKGKTTAALGLAFRALGREMPVAVVQFVKGRWKTGERLFAAQLPRLTFLTMGEGFTWTGGDPEVHARAARRAWAVARELLASGEHRVVVLDELTHALRHGFVPLADVLAALAARPEGVTVVVTGRDAAPELVAAADLVTEMRSVRHPYERGIRAIAGVDY